MSPLNFMIENKHYRFIDCQSDSSHTSIEILCDDFAGVVYHYTNLKISENEKVGAIIAYNFKIERGNELYEISELENDADFKSVMNRILNKILTEKYNL